MDQAERREFLVSHRTAVFGFGRKADGPAMSIVYYVMDGEDVLVSTMSARGKAKAVHRNPKVSLMILDEKWPPTYLLVYGDAKVERDLDAVTDLNMRILGLMAGEPTPEERRAQVRQSAIDEDRVVLRIRPYASFETPPRHVHKPEDLDGLTHWASTVLAWA
ncbi:pyridoxamine 5'-phosphate oxidase family protein [Desertimonas flava]|uniref:pyridoxamine 5'-phosphate oxidase family protein n=1 Tax=Desertimonas flava TaxID=2064846 RepID=UPI000E344893|nr:pyridoxamine 5'-phosphate oxidase family protein [Desertimonas flava]